MVLLNKLDLASFFGAVAGGDTLPVRKPDGRHLSHVIEQLGPANGAVMVGDNANDVAVAHAVGIPAIVVSYGYPRMPLADLGADFIINSFSDLPATLQTIDALTAAR
jgi:phosphoglycolate phosphatase